MMEIYRESILDLLSVKPVMTGDHLKDGINKFSDKEIKLKDKQHRDGTSTTYIEGLTSADV